MKIVCIGRNYSLHAKELNNEVPDEPVFFLKPASALLRKNYPFYIPEFTQQLEYEVEVVLRICKNGKFIERPFAKDYFDKVGLGIDFTARDIQNQLKNKGLPWEKAKAFDNSAFLGDLVPKEAFKNLKDLSFSLKKNEVVVQQGNTKDMLFDVESILCYISRYCTLNIGDLIFTGTPAGVGAVQPGDSLTGYIEELLNFELKIK